MFKNRNLFFLFLILLFGFFIRVYKLGNLPLYGDELTMVYDSYSLFKTGQDQLGNRFPLNFSMGEGRPAGYVYASIPFVAVFGPGVWGVRSLSILSGLGVIILTYLLGKKLFSEKVGLSASFIASVSPWEISLSRGGFETHLALFLALLGVVFFLSSKGKHLNILWGVVSWGAAVHTYATYRIVLPLFLFVVIYFLGGIRKTFELVGVKRFMFFSFLFLFFTLTSIQQTFFSSSIDRASGISVFSNKELREKLIQKINYDRTVGKADTFAKYFHNKPLEQSMVLIGNYFKSVSVEFLFLIGDGNPRHNMAEMGEFYWVEAIFIILGLYLLAKSGKKKILFLLLGWILLSPIASAVTGDPHALRSSFMLPPLIILSALGVAEWPIRLLRLHSGQVRSGQTVITLGIIAVWFLQFVLLLERTYFIAPAKHGRFWSEMAKTASLIALENKGKYDLILLSSKIDNIKFGYQVYAKLDPWQVISQNQKPIEINGIKEVRKFDNVLIGRFPDAEVLINNLPGKVLYVGDISEKFEFPEYKIIESGDKIGGLVLREKNR